MVGCLYGSGEFRECRTVMSEALRGVCIDGAVGVERLGIQVDIGAQNLGPEESAECVAEFSGAKEVRGGCARHRDHCGRTVEGALVFRSTAVDAFEEQPNSRRGTRPVGRAAEDDTVGGGDVFQDGFVVVAHYYCFRPRGGGACQYLGDHPVCLAWAVRTRIHTYDFQTRTPIRT